MCQYTRVQYTVFRICQDKGLRRVYLGDFHAKKKTKNIKRINKKCTILGETYPSLCKYCQNASFLPIAHIKYIVKAEPSVAEVQYVTYAQ